jgi:ABC transport system ATP-binding/permease protein
MNILSVENLSKQYRSSPLFESVTFGLDEADRVGVIGMNGSGKSTLLRLIAGVEVPDSGRVVTAKNRTIAYLPQNPAFVETDSVLDTVFPPESDVMRLVHDYERACEDLARQETSDVLERISDLTHRLELAGGWDFEANARAVLTRLGIADTRASMGALSGGQRKRVALARALVARSDLLILDEPTNHLDADTIAWLEAYLAKFSGALLLVTHDRYFLDRVTTRMLDIDRGTVQIFAGNFSRFVEQKAEQEALRAVEEQKRQSMIRREVAWLRRGAQARSTKAKARVQRAEALITQPAERARAELDIALGSSRLGKKILELHAVSKSYGATPVLDGFTYTVKRDDRIGIVGPNGAGKTTLLEIIAGRVEPDSGRVERGQTVVIGYCDQESRALDDEKRVVDYVRDVAEYVETADGSRITASQMLEKFLFPSEAQYAPISRLSGGERRRLYLLRVLMGAPNVLVLDEPTNDLDIPTLATLEEYLDSFPGCLVVASHDRYFLDNTVDHVFRFEGGGVVRAYPGNFSAAEEMREREAPTTDRAAPVGGPADATPKAAESRAAGAQSGPRKLTFNERRELDALESRIDAAERRKAVIQAEMSVSGSDAAVVHSLYCELQALDEALDRDLARWAELAEFA